MRKFEVIRINENTTEERFTVEAEHQDEANRLSLGMEPHTIKETSRSQVLFEPYRDVTGSEDRSDTEWAMNRDRQGGA